MSAAFEGNWRRRGPPAAAGVSLDSAGWYLFCLWRQVWGGYVFVEGGRSKKPFSKLFSLVSYPFLLLLQSSCLKHFLKEKDWLLCTLAHYVQLCSAYLWDKQIQPKLPNLKLRPWWAQIVMYSSLPNSRVGPNKRDLGKISKNPKSCRCLIIVT